jgi:hypothetical protein
VRPRIAAIVAASASPWAAKKSAESGPPKPVVLRTQARRVIVGGADPQRGLPALAQPVGQADVVGVHVGDQHAHDRQALQLVGKNRSHCALASSRVMQQSTTVQPLTPWYSSASSHRLM